MSISASAENLTTENQQMDANITSSMCLELALEGERLCKSGDCTAGVAFLQAALQAGGCEDLRTLSAIYSQLGNACFYLGDFAKALFYHKRDLALARSLNDKSGEAKSSGNLGNTFKVMGRFDEAILWCERHLELARELNDEMSESRALYNLGNVYHAKGKHLGKVGHKDPGEFDDEVKECLKTAVEYYEANLRVMRSRNVDIAAQGRTVGNLGNALYLLGDFAAAARCHTERLHVARQFGDRAAERRAHANLGNAHIFLGKFQQAAEHYKRTLVIAQELNDRAIEAQACYSLGNTYTLLRDYRTAIEYHLRHLLIAQQLGDRVGEGRACWSLGNANAAIGNHEKALHFANKHLSISTELNDEIGITTAKLNISDLRKILGNADENQVDSAETKDEQPNMDVERNETQVGETGNTTENTPQSFKSTRSQKIRRESMEQLSLIKLTPDAKQRPDNKFVSVTSDKNANKTNEDDDHFFDLLSKFQSKRMDDQRCDLQTNCNFKVARPPPSPTPDSLLDLIAGVQSQRMDEQRATLPQAPPISKVTTNVHAEDEDEDDEASGMSAAAAERFLDFLARCQSARLDDQRSEIRTASTTPSNSSNDMLRISANGDLVDDEDENNRGQRGSSMTNTSTTVPDDDFFSLVVRVQSGGRMEDQRAVVPPAPAPSHIGLTNGSIPTNDASAGNNGNGRKKK